MQDLGTNNKKAPNSNAVRGFSVGYLSPVKGFHAGELSPGYGGVATRR